MREKKSEIDMKQLWAYYREVAGYQGSRRSDQETETADRPQAGFSVWWFYAGNSDGLNPLTRAFLGDRDARLDWDQPLPDGLERFFLEDDKDANGRVTKVHGPDDFQAEAIRTALAQPISFIKGPPGMGKTATILNLISCILQMGKTVAIVSSNRSAVANIHQKAGQLPGARPNQAALKRSLAELGSKSVRDGGRAGEGGFAQRTGDQRFRFCSQPVRYSVGEDRQSVQRESAIRAETFLETYPAVTSTIHSLKNCFVDGAGHQYDYVIMDEASQTSLTVGIVAMSSARHLVLVGDEFQLPPVQSEDRVNKMNETLRGKLGELPPPPFVLDAEKSFFDVCMEVFLGEESTPGKRSGGLAGGHAPTAYLGRHYRCRRGIIGFCNRAVYARNGMPLTIWDQTPGIPIRVLWFRGNYGEKCGTVDDQGRAARPSKRNRKQIAAFMEEELPELMERIKNGDLPNGACILSPLSGTDRGAA